MTATDTSPVSVASYFVNMYFVGCLRRNGLYKALIIQYRTDSISEETIIVIHEDIVSIERHIPSVVRKILKK